MSREEGREKRDPRDWSGAAGWSAVRALREVDRESRLTVVSEEPLGTYLRVLLTEYVAGRRGEAELMLADARAYQALGAGLVAGSQVVAVDVWGQRAMLADGQELRYDGLLLATGAKPATLATTPLNDVDIIGLRTLQDARRIRSTVLSGGRVVVVGGGPVGVKLTIALIEASARPVLVVSSGQILSQIADAEAACLVQNHLARAGADIRLGSGIATPDPRAGQACGVGA